MEDNSCKTPRWRLFKARLNNLSPETARDFIATHSSLVIIDVRTPREFEAGHIENAINLDYFCDSFYDRLEALDPEKTYLVYCRSGRRSIRTCTLMINGGLSKERVYNMEGGWVVWQDLFQLT